MFAVSGREGFGGREEREREIVVPVRVCNKARGIVHDVLFACSYVHVRACMHTYSHMCEEVVHY